jgi:TldD protein
MDELIRSALGVVEAAGVAYGDVRVIAPQRVEHLAVQNGEASGLTYSDRAGLGVRVRTTRAWGFASTSELTPAAARSTARLALRVAQAASRSAPGPLRLTDEDGPDGGSYRSAYRIDPFEIPLDEKLALLTDAERRLHVDPDIKTGLASYQAWDEDKWFASTDGRTYRSRIIHVGAGVSATAIAGGEVQRRSGPNSFGGNFAQSGFEFVREMDLPALAERVGREAHQLLSAPSAPTGRMSIVLSSDQLALQVHESIGHATELDRILAMEAGYAGTSWVAKDQVGSLEYGSPSLSIVADATEPGGLGTFGWDDEGVPAQRTPLIDRGRLVGLLTSRETAPLLGLDRSGGTARAEGANRAPLIRMTNIDLAPGDLSFDELLEGVDEGVYFETNRSWSIDDRRLNFQFGTEVGRRIVRGELGELVRNPIYAGMTPEFWRSMDAAGDRSTWKLWGVPNCGKGQPGQVARVGHGAPVGRFRNVAVRGG